MKRYSKAAFLLSILTVFCFFGYPGAALSQVLDSSSAECVKCHQASIVPGKTPIHGEGFGHPVAIDYEELASRNRGLKSPAELDPAIKLVDKRIGCTTCHVPYSEYDHKALARKRKESQAMPDPMLVLSNSGSALCTACHLK